MRDCQRFDSIDACLILALPSNSALLHILIADSKSPACKEVLAFLISLAVVVHSILTCAAALREVSAAPHAATALASGLEADTQPADKAIVDNKIMLFIIFILLPQHCLIICVHRGH